MSTTPANDAGSILSSWLSLIKAPPSTDAKALAAHQQWLKTFENSPITRYVRSQLERTPTDQRAQLLADANAQNAITRNSNATTLDLERGRADIRNQITDVNTRELIERDTGKTQNLRSIIGDYVASDLKHKEMDVAEAGNYRSWASGENEKARAQTNQLALLAAGGDLIRNVLAAVI